MVLAPEQIQKIWLISDTVLYPEAIALIRRLVQEEEGSPLPNSQVMGLLNIAEGPQYAAVYEFVKHQRDRNWSGTKMAIKTLYDELEKYLSDMKKRRIREEFQLVTANLPRRESDLEVDELLLLLARDFIQHLIAENGVLATDKTNMRRR